MLCFIVVNVMSNYECVVWRIALGQNAEVRCYYDIIVIKSISSFITQTRYCIYVIWLASKLCAQHTKTALLIFKHKLLQWETVSHWFAITSTRLYTFATCSINANMCTVLDQVWNPLENSTSDLRDCSIEVRHHIVQF